MRKGPFVGGWVALATSASVAGCTLFLGADADFHRVPAGSTGGGGGQTSSSSGAGGMTGSGGNSATSSGEGGNSATSSGEGGNSATSSSGTGGEPPTGVVGKLGQPCPEVGLPGCAGNAQKLKLICGVDKKWATNGTCDVMDTVCDTGMGADQGTCKPVLALCLGQVAGTIVCLDLAQRAKCGPDLLTTENLDTCTNQTCVGGACVGECAAYDMQCSGAGADIQTCDKTGQWGPASSCGGAGCGCSQFPGSMASCVCS